MSDDSTPRYAIYFVPDPDSALYRFGRDVLGYDCFTGKETAHAEIPPLDAATWHRLTEEPRRYGFHTTLKAPFHLRHGTDDSALVTAFMHFAKDCAGADIEPVVRALGSFIAVVPRAATPAIAALEARCVAAFEPFRAPLSQIDIERRLKSNLSARQIANLESWGYPYVHEEFRFHMTLTGSLAPDMQAVALPALARAFGIACDATPLAINRLALMRQDERAARFRVLRHATLR
jgi:putative phosphonate metabolism protein